MWILLTKFLGESPRGREILESVINDLYPESDLEFDEETRDVIQTNALTETLDKLTEAEFEVPLKSVVKQPKPGPKKPQLA